MGKQPRLHSSTLIDPIMQKAINAYRGHRITRATLDRITEIYSEAEERLEIARERCTPKGSLTSAYEAHARAFRAIRELLGEEAQDDRRG